jgi:DNA-binding XRE family transcriptional regulator
MDIEKLKEQSMQDPAFKEAYEALEGEFNVASELIRARASAGLTQAQVAQRMGTKQSAVSQIEGGRNISLARLRAYAKAVGREVEITLR